MTCTYTEHCPHKHRHGLFGAVECRSTLDCDHRQPHLDTPMTHRGPDQDGRWYLVPNITPAPATEGKAGGDFSEDYEKATPVSWDKKTGEWTESDTDKIEESE